MDKLCECHWLELTKEILSDIPEINERGVEHFLYSYRKYFGLLSKGYDYIDDFINYACYLHVIARDYMENKIKFDKEKQVFYIVKRIDLFDKVG